MALIHTGGSFFLDSLGDDSIFAKDTSTIGQLAAQTLKEVDAEYTRTVKSIAKVDVAKSRAMTSEAPKGRKVRFLIKKTAYEDKFKEKEGKAKKNYCTLIGADEPLGVVTSDIQFEKIVEFFPLGEEGFAYLSDPENHATQLYKSIQLYYALYADWKTAFEADDQVALASHPKLLTASPHFYTSRFIPQSVRDYVVLAHVPQYGPPAKEGTKKIPPIHPRDYAAFIADAMQDEKLIAEVCQAIYTLNVERGIEVYHQGDCFAANVPKDRDPRDGKLRKVPKEACGIATGYIARVSLVSPKTSVYKGRYTEGIGMKVGHFWKHDDSMWKMLLEIPPREVFNFQVEARDFTHSLRFAKKYDKFHLAVIPLRAFAMMRWSTLFAAQLDGKDDEEKLQIRSTQKVGFATFGPYVQNESNFKRETYAGKSKSPADRDKLKSAREGVKKISTVGSVANIPAAQPAGSAVPAKAAGSAEEKKAPTGVYFDWYLMHLEVDQGPLTHDLSETNFTDINTNVFSTYIQVNLSASALRTLGIGFNDYEAAKAIVQPMLYTASLSIESAYNDWGPAVSNAEKMCNELIREKTQPAHEEAWERMIAALKSAHSGNQAMAQRGIYRIDKVEHKNLVGNFLSLAMNFNRADRVVVIDKVDSIVMDVAATIARTGWKVSKNIAVQLEQSVSERLTGEESPVAHFKFGVGVEMIDGIKLVNASFQEGISFSSGMSEEKFDFYVVGYEKPFKPRTSSKIRPYGIAETDVLFCQAYYDACRSGAEEKEEYIKKVKEANPALCLTTSSAPDLSEGPTSTLFALYAVPKNRPLIIGTDKFRELTTGSLVKPEPVPAPMPAPDIATDHDSNFKKRKRDDSDVKPEHDSDEMDSTDVPLPGEVPSELKSTKIEELPDADGW
mgnify:CR=1 FL=1|tara:strand:- start:1467 stop:4160 length:2694 start_codon:yes stop_codon:yes gene_type:complete